MTELSPAARAVLDAFRTSHTGQGCLAAALRAVADQVVPAPCFASDDAIRDCILAIAAELEGHG